MLRDDRGKTGSEGFAVKKEKVTENVYLCRDGKYRWVYEFDMLRNPTILITLWKVFGLSLGLVFLFVFVLDVFQGNIGGLTDAWSMIWPFLLILLFLMVLGIIAYLILAASYGWKYMVLFTMDETGVEHRQMKKQFDKAEALGWLAAAGGLVSGNMQAAGAGLLAATRDTSTSTFEKVRKVKSNRGRHVIYVNQTLDHNQVYAEDADFDFVRDYIIRRCVNAKRAD